MQKTCKQCTTQFEITDDDLQFYDKVSPVFNGVKCLIPPPTLCPDCRQQRRLTFRNERHLYSRKCNLCGKDMIGVYSSDKKRKVYCNECWHSDQWEGLEYAKDIDLSRSFFDQFYSLFQEVPIEGTFVQNSENSVYTNLAGYNRNCYLIFNSTNNENCYYARGLAYCQDSMEIYFGAKNELCYEDVNCHNCYHLLFSQNCYQCRDSSFLYNCTGCSDCFGCTNLQHKQYYIFNQPYSEQEYKKKMKEIIFSSSNLQNYQQKFTDLVASAVHRENQNINTENCIGDYLANCKNCMNCFEVNNGEDCKFCDSTKLCKNVYDAFGHCINSELQYEVVATGKSQQMLFCFNCDNCHDVSYSAFCSGSHHLFGCIGVRNKSYCILNKQYTKEDYERMVVLLIECMQKNSANYTQSSEWGQFFPCKLSPYSYNETIAQEYYPLTKEQTIELGSTWKEEDFTTNHSQKIMIPPLIQDVSDEITKEVLTCEKCNKHYRIIRQELKFYRKEGLPIPLFCPDCRHKMRMMLRNPRKLWARECDKCEVGIQTSYALERPATPLSGGSRSGGKKVYCEQCYLKEVY